MVLIGLVLGFFAGIMIWSYTKATQQVKIAGAALDNLHAVVKIRSRVARQKKEVMDYVVGGEEQEKREFEEFGKEARDALDEWIKSIQEQIELGAEGKEEDLEEAKDMENKYNETLKLVTKAFQLRDTGKTQEAYEFMEEKLEPSVDDVLFERMDRVISDEIGEFIEAYDKVLISLGSIPWVVETGREQVEIARASTRYSLIVDGARFNIIRQIKEVMDYIISGEESDKTQFEEFGIEAKRALNEWKKYIKIKMELGAGVERDIDKLRGVESKYDEALAIIRKALELANAGKTEDAFELMEDKVEILTDDFLFPEITKVVEDSKREVIKVQQNLLDLMLSAEEQGIGALAIVSLVIFSVSFGLIRGMIASLNKLRKGTEIIGSGRLDHRIDLKSGDELGQLAYSFDKMAEALEKSRDEIIGAKEYADKILSSMNDSLIVVSPDGHIQTVNDVTCEMLGYKEEELIYKPIEKIFDEESLSEKSEIDDLFKERFIRGVEKTYQTKDGRKILVLFSSSIMRDGNRIQGIVCVARDITERKQIEEARKKELLLKEIHHRIKNNLQIVSTLLDLQAKYLKDEQTVMMFKESQNRIRSMAFIHEKLYMSKDLERIDFAEYINDLTGNLLRSYGVNSKAIKLKINVSDVLLSIDTAVPCGLIINELVSNSLKYAFPAGREGEVRIDFHSDDNDDRFILIISDDGIGFPEDLDFQNTKSLGLKLVNTLARQQLKGTMDLNRNGGTEFKIVFTAK